MVRRRPLPSAPRIPIDNEIPDSANVQASPGQGADVPSPVENRWAHLKTSYSLTN